MTDAATPASSDAEATAARQHRLLTAALVFAITAPTLLAYNLSPSATFFNQALSVASWGAVLVVLASGVGGHVPWRQALRTAAAPLLAIGLVFAAGLWRAASGAWPSSLAIGYLGMLLATAALLWLACAAAMFSPSHSASTESGSMLSATAWAFFAAGMCSVPIAAQQMFWPGLSDGGWLATVDPGRAIGNLRQPNQLGTLALWALVALAWLHAQGRLRTRVAAAAAAALVMVIVWSASRTAVAGLLLLSLWGGAFAAPWPKRTRLGLLLLPLIYAFGLLLMWFWAQSSQSVFTGSVRVTDALTPGSDFSSGRTTMVRQVFSMLHADPWLGVGLGGFNFAWTLSALQPVMLDFFDHTHNLPLQMLVELGVLLGSVVIGCLLWSLWQCRRSWLFWLLLMVGLHSFLEYPLWYAYFLLPTAWAMGLALAQASKGAAAPASGPGVGLAPVRALSPPALPLLATGLAFIVFIGAALVDYRRVVVIFHAPPNAAPLAQRIDEGRRHSWLFGHHADYAAATLANIATGPGAPPLPAEIRSAFHRPTQHLLDSRLMQSFSQALEASGEHDLARHLAKRLRDTRLEEAAPFFSMCPPQPLPMGQGAAVGLPFQCEAASRKPGWHEYRALLDTPAWQPLR